MSNYSNRQHLGLRQDTVLSRCIYHAAHVHQQRPLPKQGDAQLVDGNHKGQSGNLRRWANSGSCAAWLELEQDPPRIRGDRGTSSLAHAHQSNDLPARNNRLTVLSNIQPN